VVVLQVLTCFFRWGLLAFVLIGTPLLWPLVAWWAWLPLVFLPGEALLSEASLMYLVTRVFGLRSPSDELGSSHPFKESHTRREKPSNNYPWDGISGVKPFRGFASTKVVGVYWTSTLGYFATRYGRLIRRIIMPMNIDDIIERALEHAFSKALEQVIQQKAEAAFQKAFSNGSPFSQKLEAKIQEGFERFFEKGIRWEKKKPGFKN
jgi:hypothetical protein